MTINPLLALPPEPTTSGGNIYGDYMQAFFATLSTAEKQQIWVRFLAENKLTDPPPIDIETQKLFMSFVQQVYNSQQRQVTSPEEIKKRNIMFLVLNEIIDMLLSLQNTVGVQGNTLTFYGRWQQEYTRMLVRVPTYVGGTSSLPSVNLNDLSKFTFGYNDISVRDIAAWAANTVATLGPSEQKTFVMQGTPFSTHWQGSGPLEMQTSYIITVNGGGAVSMNLETKVVRINNRPFQPAPGYTSQLAFQYFNISDTADFDAKVNDFENGFRSWYNALPPSLNLVSWMGATDGNSDTLIINGTFLDNGEVFPPTDLPIPIPEALNVSSLPILTKADLLIRANNEPFITNNDLYAPLRGDDPSITGISQKWLYTYVSGPNITDNDDPFKKLADTESKSRGEMNSRDQQYIENVRSRRQVVQDASQQAQANLDQSRQTVSQQADLFTSLIDSLKGLIASIFR